MFQLLQSIWMFAAAGIIIPVIIHFWNKKQGKILKVGSISLLTESYKQQAKSLQLQERLLLLLRCLLILLIAFLLSHPLWNEQPDPSKQHGWILMEKQGLQQTYAQFKPSIDSLIKKQYEFHYFESGFEKDNLENVLKNEKGAVIGNNRSYWSLLSLLDQQVPASIPVYLFTTNSLKRFTGSRPKVTMNLLWYTYVSKDSVSEWLAKAYTTTADSIRLVAASSQPSGTSYLYTTATLAPQKKGDYNILVNNSNISVSYQSNEAIIIDTASLKITIFTDKYKNDAAYVKAAFEAIQQYSGRKIKISEVTNSSDIQPRQDWLFWLADQPIPTVDAKNVFMYEKGKADVAGSSIQTGKNGNEGGYVALYKRIPYQPSSSSVLLKTIWQDGFGKPLLALERNNIPVYHFFSRFDPSWSDLPWSSSFPQAIFSLICNTPDNLGVSDKRVMDEEQLQPTFTADNTSTVKEKFMITHDLTEAFWLAAFVIFFVERYLSFRIKMEKANA